MNEQKLLKLKQLLELTQNDTITPKEVEKFLNVVLDVIKKSKDSLEKMSEENLNTISQSIKYIEQRHSEILSNVDNKNKELKKGVDSKMDTLNTLIKEFKSLKIKDGIDGYTPIKDIDYFDGEDGKDGSPDTPKEIKDKLETLKDEERLDFSAIKGLDTLEKGITDRAIGILDSRTKYLVNKNVKHDATLSGSGTDADPLKVVGGTGGASAFTDLTDVPSAYTGQGGKVVAVKADVSGLEFVASTGTDEKVKYDAGDPTAGYVADKIVAGTGISVAEGSGATENKLVVTNSAPDQTVALTAGTNITSITGAYPNFTINAATQAGTIDGSGTTNEIPYWVDSNTLGSLAVVTYPSLTELSYIKGITSAVQTQLGTKAPTTAPTFATSITGSYLTASEILITDASKNIVSAPVATYPSLTELTYLKGVSSAIQTQLNAKGTGNVTKVGTPVDNQVGVWTGDGTIEGTTGLTFATGALTVNNTLNLGAGAGGTLNFVGANTPPSISGGDYFSNNQISYIANQHFFDMSQISGVFAVHNTSAASYPLYISNTGLVGINTIGNTGYNFQVNGTTDITGALSVGGTVSLGANSLTMTGSLAATGARVTKGWFTDIESTNMPTVGGTAILTSLTAPQFTTVELGHATDTTISRVSAGVVAIEGVNILTTSSTSTTTNKRNQPRIVSATSYTTDTGTSLDVSTCDIFVITAQAGALKFNNPSGTPTQGEKILVRIKDNGTARALTYDTQYRAIGTALPSTTIANKTLYMGFIWNATDSKFDLVTAPQEA